MAKDFSYRMKKAWNAFVGNDNNDISYDVSYSYRPDRTRMSRGNEKSIVTSIYNRIALDVSSMTFQHVKLDSNNRYLETLNTKLNSCLTLEANIDQISRAFIQDVVLSMFDEGSVAIIPIETSNSPLMSDGYDIYSMRTGKILEWGPKHVRVRVYNDSTGKKEDIKLPKKMVGIVENPLYSVMNEPNSTVKRLVRKLALLDRIDEQSSSGKLDLVIQLPYMIKTESRRAQAEKRRKDIEEQLAGSRYGIAYTDGTEKITQLNRPVENNLMTQIQYLTDLVYSQLGITQAVLDGSADEKTMMNYYNRTIEPIVSAITDEMKRKFLSKTARSRKETIMCFRDPFKLVPITSLAEIADKFTRNEILTSNEIRQIVGMKPADDPNADMLKNSNISRPNDENAINTQMDENNMSGENADIEPDPFEKLNI